MASFDFDSLLEPVSADRPAGEDLEYDPLFSEMEQAAAGKPEQQMGDAVIEAEEPDWRLVQKNALALLKRSKDLRVAIYFCQATLRNEGLEGFGESLRLASELTTQFWPSIHPELDEDDDNDPTARVNAVMTLTAGSLLQTLERAPLLSVPMLGAVCWADVKPVGGDDDPGQESGEAEAIISHCELELIASRRQAVEAALDACKSLETFITQQVGASQAPNLQPLRDLLKRMAAQLGRWWDQRGGDESSAEEEDSDDGGGESSDNGDRPATPSPGQKVVSGPMGPITSRQEAIAAIDRILEYYQRHEPSSPLPLLLLRAKRLATKSFIEILQDLIPEGLGRAHEIGGLSHSSGDNTSGGGESYVAPSTAPPAATTDTDDDSDDDFFS